MTKIANGCSEKVAQLSYSRRVNESTSVLSTIGAVGPVQCSPIGCAQSGGIKVGNGDTGGDTLKLRNCVIYLWAAILLVCWCENKEYEGLCGFC